MLVDKNSRQLELFDQNFRTKQNYFQLASAPVVEKISLSICSITHIMAKI
jgi:hypothetical protein